MSNSFYVDITDTIINEWSPFPHGPNHENINEIPGIIEPRIKPFTRYVPFTIDVKNYNSDQRYTLDAYAISFVLPTDAVDIKMYIGTRMRTLHHCGWFYANVSLYNGTDHWYTLRKVLTPHQWEPVHSDVIEGWANSEVSSISRIKLEADINPIEVANLYLYIEFLYANFIYYGTGKIYGTGWNYGSNPI
jgi:hypothetical protein